jgi:hypothetical protein
VSEKAASGSLIMDQIRDRLYVQKTGSALKKSKYQSKNVSRLFAYMLFAFQSDA